MYQFTFKVIIVLSQSTTLVFSLVHKHSAYILPPNIYPGGQFLNFKETE